MFSGVTIAWLSTVYVQNSSVPSTVRMSSQTATSYMSPRGLSRSCISSAVLLTATMPSERRTKAILGTVWNASRISAFSAGRVSSIVQ